MATAAATYPVQVPRIEDEIEQTYKAWLEQTDLCWDERENSREIFEAGFRAARTVMVKEWTA